MKIEVSIIPVVSRMLETSYDLPKLKNALDAAYNDGTAVVETEGGISSAKATEKKNLFNSRDGIVQKREGKLSDPLRFIAWNTAITSFFKRNGDPHGDLSPSILPANLVFWLDTKFAKVDAKSDGKTASNGNPRSNGNLGSNGKTADTGKTAGATK